MKKMGKKLCAAVLALLICLMAVSLTAVAWFFINDRTPMRFEILEIQSKVTLYDGNDQNLNGVPDRAGEDIVMHYYTEPYRFEKIGEAHAVTEDASAEITIALEFSALNLLPGQIRTFKLALENTGDTDNEVQLLFDLGFLSEEEKAFLGMWTVRACRVVKAGEDGSYRLEQGEKIWLMDRGETGVTAAVFSDMLPGMATAEMSGDPESIYLDFWLQLCMEPLVSVNRHIEEQNAAGASLTPLTADEYNAYAGQAADQLLFRVTFDVTA